MLLALAIASYAYWSRSLGYSEWWINFSWNIPFNVLFLMFYLFPFFRSAVARPPIRQQGEQDADRKPDNVVS